MNEFEQELAKEVAKQVPIKEIYDDLAKPTALSAGQTVGLIPRAINAALSNLQIWILQKEYNVAETKKLLEMKLKSISPELIVSPEPYIAVPALQAISYCMNNELLRDMYANLLANSMTNVIKDGVHPAYVEIIKQLSPDEAKILKLLNNNKILPILNVNKKFNDKSGYYDVLRNFSVIGYDADCEYPNKTPELLENLSRLKLINISADEYVVKDGFYEKLFCHQIICKLKEEILPAGELYSFEEGFIEMSIFGNSFSNICINSPS